MPHLVIMAAGTGGHIIPGIAVAREVQRRGWSVSWLGTATGMENTLVPPTQIPLDVLAFSGLRGKGLLHTATGGLRLLKAFWDAARILRRRSYRHPVYNHASVAAQARRHEIQGVNRTWFSGAYWGWGFHEDGMRSGVDVARGLGVDWPVAAAMSSDVEPEQAGLVAA